MALKSIMSTPVVTIELDDDLETVKHIFDNTTFHHLLVVEDKKLYGVISDRDLLKAISPHLNTAAETERDLATLNKKAHQIMTRKPIVLKENDSVYAAIEIFNQHKISCIPIIDDNFSAVGIVTWRDLLQAIGKQWQKQARQKQA